MEGHCSTGQRPQRAVAPMEKEEEDDVIHHWHYLHELCQSPCFILYVRFYSHLMIFYLYIVSKV